MEKFLTLSMQDFQEKYPEKFRNNSYPNIGINSCKKMKKPMQKISVSAEQFLREFVG